MPSSTLGAAINPGAVVSEAHFKDPPKCSPSSDLGPERRRVQELLRYYQPSASDVHNVDLDNVKLSSDPTLTALAQVGALRTNCDRSFLSLMTKDNQHILAEATRTISIINKDSHGPGDRVFLGARTLDLDWGVCPSTIKVFTSTDGSFNVSTPNVTARPSSYVMNDMSLEECFKDRPYVKGFPYMKFYAEVPLETSSGYVIGSYCVVDNRRRENEDHEKILSIIREVASTIMNHLELVQFKQSTLRAERIVDGLSRFVAGAGNSKSSVPRHKLSRSSSPKGIKDQPKVYSRSPLRLGITNTLATSPIIDNNTPSPDIIDPTQLQDPAEDPQWSNDSTETLVSAPSTATMANMKPKISNCSMNTQNRTGALLVKDKATTKNRSLAPKSVTDTLSRASTIIKEANDLDGVMFVDASFYSPFTRDTEPSDICSALSCSTRPGVLNHPDEEVCNFPGLTEAFLGTLLVENPAGGVFFYDEAGFITLTHNESLEERNNESTSNVQNAAAANLTSILPGARSIAIWPLKHPDESSWLAVGFAWSSDPHRPIRAEDFTYLRAFGNSIMVEISRLEIISADRAKSDFLSSISHELRSPLHGVLANAELLAATTSDLDQREMISSIELCGRTLLDTMNHLLDYAKINNFNTKTKGGELPITNTKGIGSLISTFDMSTMVQDVVQGVLSGHRHYVASTRALGSDADISSGNRPSLKQVQPQENTKIQCPSGDDLMVILDIESRQDWTFVSEAGAWKRILMNIFGNALKYTDKGFIKVSLRCDDNATKKGTQNSGSVVTLQVSDSGRGMSPEFLQNNLFTPFVQEDTLSVGAGLGLSIVQQIVTSLGGTIQVSSEQFVGTTITISASLESPAASIKLTDHADSDLITHTRNEIAGMTISFAGLHTVPKETSSLTKITNTPDQNLKDLTSSLSQMASTWFGLSINYASDLQSASGDFVLTTDILLDAYLRTRNEDAIAHWETIGTPLIVLRTTGDESLSSPLPSWDIGRVIILTAPIGPRRFAKVLGTCQRYKASRSRIAISGSTSSLTLVPTGLSHSLNQNEQVQSLTFLANALTISDDPPPLTTALNTPDLIPQLEKPTEQGNPQTVITASPSARVLNLLLVEDNGINLKILVTYMKRLKHTFTTATNGLEALEKYKAAKLPFDYVIMDISMPVMNGYTSTREIRAFEAENGRRCVPIVALTGLASTSAQNEAYSCGVTTFLTKPVRLSELKKVLGS
ncbi:hypothetical protein BP6252_01921 [Coleophoma cylindrospora]|uniref:Uncharacterized protein n=1 Tax=Coleophoma cylindrospora TaxID=1849047 RepID=A0A3D8SDT3_9HELO|nr:hypothetical protein BP6252_01921 [Coleophoma cylindrospora]